MGLFELLSSKIKISEAAQEAIGVGGVVGSVVTYALTKVAAVAAFAHPIGAGVGLLAGTGVYLYQKCQEAALSAIEKDGLTPKGAPIANGKNNQTQKVLMKNQQTTKGT